MTISKPQTHEYGAFYQGYMNFFDEKANLFALLSERLDFVKDFYTKISEEKSQTAYAQGKWTIREVLGHIIDCERIMAYRTLCVARGEKKALPGFEQDDYMQNANFNQRTLQSLLEEFILVRQTTLQLFENLDENAINQLGNANNNTVSVRALCGIIVGHEIHHTNIITERYL